MSRLRGQIFSLNLSTEEVCLSNLIGQYNSKVIYFDPQEFQSDMSLIRMLYQKISLHFMMKIEKIGHKLW